MIRERKPAGREPWEIELLRVCEAATDGYGLRNERAALRAIVRSRVFNARMFRAAIVAVLAWDQASVTAEVQRARANIRAARGAA